MSGPKIEVLGVYALPVTPELIREQTDILYGVGLKGQARSDAEQEAREQLTLTVLLEVIVHDRDARFDVGDFCQQQDGSPRENWQVAWAEAYLSLDGQSLLVERWGTPPTVKDFRVSFFTHNWNPTQPLATSYGPLMCPQVDPMPVRLQQLAPYEPVD